jgi:hypothetical protein
MSEDMTVSARMHPGNVDILDVLARRWGISRESVVLTAISHLFWEVSVADRGGHFEQITPHGTNIGPIDWPPSSIRFRQLEEAAFVAD